ncbi:probable G-protein coupled receptor 34 [Lates japonicus]|uniref:Probable G-protein coupled receptor 34 n=1 Tax=Lates japonicus TaxID=270547 RepID=A0AAD3NN72_LATJO|nr:probable G-protein coupled receptor 34 [Lates japonicus]
MESLINIFVIVVFWLVFISLVVSYGKMATRLKNIWENQTCPMQPALRTARKSFFILFVFLCFVPYHIVRVFCIKLSSPDIRITRRMWLTRPMVALVFLPSTAAWMHYVFPVILLGEEGGAAPGGQRVFCVEMSPGQREQLTMDMGLGSERELTKNRQTSSNQRSEGEGRY